MKLSTAVSLLGLFSTAHGCEVSDVELPHPCSSASLAKIKDYLISAGCTNYDDLDENKVTEACKKAAVPFGDLTNMFYQHDKAYMGGGSIWNDGIAPDSSTELGKRIAVDLDRVRRVTTSAATDDLIAWPTYKALDPFYANNFVIPNQESYMSEFNKTESCDLNTVMCCFTNKEEGELEPDEATSDVCAHDLHDSTHSNHVNRGWGVYDQKAACVGFTFSDDVTTSTNRFAGNSIFDVSFRNKYENKYVKNIPGAPLCACIEKMPTVTDAKCRETVVTGEKFTFSYNDEDFHVSDISANVEFNDCKDSNGDDIGLKQHASDVFDTDLSEKLTGDSNCDVAKEEMRNEKFWISGTPEVDRYETITDDWQAIVGQEMQFYPLNYDISRQDRTKFGIPLMEDELKLREAIGANECEEFIIRRQCNFCYKSHIDIYYKRFTCLPPADEFKFLDLLMNNWVYANNTRGIDFNLYSTLEDAEVGTASNDPNAWSYCNYVNPGSNFGFPFECGPSGKVGYNWNSFRRGTHNEAKSIGFYYKLNPVTA